MFSFCVELLVSINSHDSLVSVSLQCFFWCLWKALNSPLTEQTDDEEQDEDDEACAICTEDFYDRPIGHIFH